MSSDIALRRRALIAGTGGTLAATAGCVGELRNLIGRERTRQLSLSILTLPADDDPYAVRIANRLTDNLERVGIDVRLEPVDPDQLSREVLVNHDFDIYVWEYPSQGDPDELRTLLHSEFGEEAGWQNPFGFSNLEVDDLLDDQQALPREERIPVVGDLQRRIVREQPFTVLGFADRIAGVRDDRFDRWPEGGPAHPLDYLELEPTAESDTIELLLRDPRVTRNRNPIAVEHRGNGVTTGLLYEPLVWTLDGERTPWLARSVEWETGGEQPAATVTLRETSWHDGERLTAADVAFSYAFLKDTSLGEFDTPVPTPWRRGRLALVERAEVLSESTVRIEFSTTERDVADRALEAPMLPAHVWREYTDAADVAGVDVVGGTTEALVWANEEPVGSGPLRFVEATADEELVLEAFEEHFLEAGDTTGIPQPYAEGLPFERARFRVVPSDEAAVQVLADDGADATAESLGASVVPRIVRTDGVSLTVARVDPFYHVGYNCRRAPLSNPRFRRAVARLLDKEHVVSTVFDDYADSSEVPLRRPWVPGDLLWDGTGELGFLGSEGELDVGAARDAFREAGYQYQDDRLVWRGES